MLAMLLHNVNQSSGWDISKPHWSFTAARPYLCSLRHLQDTSEVKSTSIYLMAAFEVEGGLRWGAACHQRARSHALRSLHATMAPHTTISSNVRCHVGGRSYVTCFGWQLGHRHNS